MKTALAFPWLSFASGVSLALAQDPTPALLGAPAPGTMATTAPETALLQAVSGDGRWLLFTSASDRLTTNDHNASLDVFLFDRTAGQTTLLSAGPDGRSGNGTSVAGGLTADAARVVFRSRATGLVANDTNATWDVLLHDVLAGTNDLVSVAAAGGSSLGAATEPQISATGRYVLFRSPARDLAGVGLLDGDNLYRRDLLEGRTHCLTTNPPVGAPKYARLQSWASTPDAQAVALTMLAHGGTSNIVVWKDLVTANTANCKAAFPGQSQMLAGKTSVQQAPAISANGRRVAFRSDISLGGTVQAFALTLCDPDQGLSTLITLRTNDTRWQTFPATALGASLSADGRFVVYSAPWPSYALAASVRTNGHSQVYLYDAQNQTTQLVSGAQEGVTPASVEATNPLLATDGRGVAFLSRATNLVVGATDERLRAYWFDREAATLHLIAEEVGPTRSSTTGLPRTGQPAGEVNQAAGLGDSTFSMAMSANGDWLALSTLGEDDSTRVICFDTRTKGISTVSLSPAVKESATSRGWIGVRPSGVSADGRYVALTTLPTEPAGGTNHMQVYRLDTQTGSRQLITQGTDGKLANGHPSPPLLSAEGSLILFSSCATNLATEDTTRVPDLYVQDLAKGTRSIVGTGLGAIAVSPSFDPVLSPDGSYVLAVFASPIQPQLRWHLVDLKARTLSPVFPGVIDVRPSFSRSGHRIALSVGVGERYFGGNTTVQIHDSEAWRAGAAGQPSPLWISAPAARDPVLSADGNRVAFLHVSSAGTNAVVVMDWARNEPLFVRPPSYLHQVPSGLDLSADGRFAVWLAPSAEGNQVWRAEVDGGKVELVSIAADGVSQANGNAKFAAISGDGRYVAFASLADNLVLDDTNGAKDIFLRDMQTSRTLLVSRTPAGAPGRGWSTQPFFSADGRNLFFLSDAADLAPGDFNQSMDLFKVEIVTDSPVLLVIRRNLTTGQTQLLWNGQSGRRYAVEFKDALEMPEWTRLLSDVTGAVPVEVSTADSSRRFYRVVQLP